VTPTAPLDLLERPTAAPSGPSIPAHSSPRSVSRRVRRNRGIWFVGLLSVALAAGLLLALGGRGASGPTRPPQPPRRHHHPAAALKTPLDSDWTGDGRPVTLAFGGDVHFPAGTNLGDRLDADPSTALGPTVAALFAGADLSMVNFESAMTDGSCPDAQPKQYVFYAPTTAIQAFQGANITLVTEANNHGEDCGQPGLQQALAARTQSGYTILGIGNNVNQAFTPYRTTINGERIAIIAATQVIDSDLQTSWTATDAQPGLASAYDVPALVAAVEQARKTADTVVVYLHWGTQLDPCPNPDQEPLAQVLVDAGADIVIGTHAHVLLGGGYLGSAYVDYGLGNFAFYDNSPPENASGALLITVTGRHIDQVTWRPALIEDDLPQPLTGAAATNALAAWNQARSCTNVAATPGTSMATPQSENSPAPAATVQQLSVDND
jgi:Bacterial capsule synthesis protein PGA_cap